MFNDKNIRKCEEVQDRKIIKPSKNSLSRNNPIKNIYNFSSVNLSGREKSLLSKGLNFTLAPASLEYSHYLFDFELFFRDTFSLEISHLDRELLKSRLKNLAFLSFKTYYSSRRPNNLRHNEFECVLKLSKTKNVVIQKSDSGNSTFSIDKIVYTYGIKKL